MPIAALLAAAESASEPSKTAFYVAGGLLVAWAVVLSLYGISRATFPATTTAERGVVAATALLVFVAMAMAVATA